MGKLGPIALFTKCKLTISCGKEIETIWNAPVICFFYEWFESKKNSNGLYIGFHLDKNQRQNDFGDDRNENKRRKVLLRYV